MCCGLQSQMCCPHRAPGAPVLHPERPAAVEGCCLSCPVFLPSPWAAGALCPKPLRACVCLCWGRGANLLECPPAPRRPEDSEPIQAPWPPTPASLSLLPPPGNSPLKPGSHAGKSVSVATPREQSSEARVARRPLVAVPGSGRCVAWHALTRSCPCPQAGTRPCTAEGRGFPGGTQGPVPGRRGQRPAAHSARHS